MRRGPYLPENASLWALVALMLGSGTTHLVWPHVYEPLIPKQLGPPRPWVIGSGIVEYACGILLVPKRTRRTAGWLTAGLFVVVFPGNVQAVVNGGMPIKGWLGSVWAAWVRLPLQIPLVLWALRHARGEGAPPMTVAEGWKIVEEAHAWARHQAARTRPEKSAERS